VQTCLNQLKKKKNSKRKSGRHRVRSPGSSQAGALLEKKPKYSRIVEKKKNAGTNCEKALCEDSSQKINGRSRTTLRDAKHNKRRRACRKPKRRKKRCEIASKGKKGEKTNAPLSQKGGTYEYTNKPPRGVKGKKS